MSFFRKENFENKFYFKLLYIPSHTKCNFDKVFLFNVYIYKLSWSIKSILPQNEFL